MTIFPGLLNVSKGSYSFKQSLSFRPDFLGITKYYVNASPVRSTFVFIGPIPK